MLELRCSESVEVFLLSVSEESQRIPETERRLNSNFLSQDYYGSRCQRDITDLLIAHGESLYSL